jgi:hypothetical protein
MSDGSRPELTPHDEEDALLIDSFPGQRKNYDDLLDTLRKYRDRAWEPIAAGQKGPHLLWVNLDRVLGSILNRSRHTLIEGVYCFNEGGIVASFLLARSALEVTGAACYLLKKIRAYEAGSLSVEELDKSTEQLTLGERCRSDDPRVPQAVNVMTMIDAADSFCAGLSDKLKGRVREVHEFLSEFVHPNHNGLRLGTRMDEQGALHFPEGSPWAEHDVVQVLTGFNISGFVTLRAGDESKQLIERLRPQEK